MIFGHGNDPDLGNGIRVTVIATGFMHDHNRFNRDEDEKKVYDLDATDTQIQLFEDDTVHVNGQSEEPPENKINYGFTGRSFEVENEDKDSSQESHFQFSDDQQTDEPARYSLEDKIEEEVTNALEEKGYEKLNMANNSDEFISKKERLIMERRRRAMELKTSNNPAISAEKFKSLLEVPAYERKKVRLQNVPHSSEKNISRYNLDDEFNLSKNNSYLHDRPD